MTAATATPRVHRVARDHCLAPSRTADAPTGGARYGRMFPGLPVLPGDTAALEAAGQPGGVCAGEAFGRAADLRDDAREAAGWPFFGQLVAHDITADRSPVGPHADVTALRNARAPKLDLEMVYGDGPVGHPYLYDVTDPARLLLGADGGDVPRNSQGVALIGDPRDDVHLLINQLHVALLHAHNGLVERLRADGVGDDTVFEEARRALTWHYQWVVAHDLLPRVVGAELVDDVLGRGGLWFGPKPGEAFLPLEFADAAYRYGHGQIRHTYRLTDGGDAVPLFPDLVGFGPVPPEHRLDLARIIDLPGRPAAQRAKRLDGTLPASLIGLPPQVTGAVTDGAYRSLAVRDLLRGEATGLPAGEAVAQAMGVSPLRPDEVGGSWPEGPRCGSTCSAKPRTAAAGNAWVRSAAGSSPRCWSGCCAPIPAPTWSSTPRGCPPCRGPGTGSAWPTCSSSPRRSATRARVVDPSPVLAVVGAGPKALAVAVKHAALRAAGHAVPDLVILDPAGVAAHWDGRAGYTDGDQRLGTPPLG